jgi:hypothetical protein
MTVGSGGLIALLAFQVLVLAWWAVAELRQVKSSSLLLMRLDG